jgi:hypothetical protein
MANLMTRYTECIESTLGDAAPGEEIDYATNFIVMGSETGHPVTVLLVMLYLRALTVGEWISSAMWIASARPTEDELSKAVREGVATMLDTRTKQAHEALHNGHGHGHDVSERLRGAIDLSGGLPPH